MGGTLHGTRHLRVSEGAQGITREERERVAGGVWVPQGDISGQCKLFGAGLCPLSPGQSLRPVELWFRGRGRTAHQVPGSW